MEVWETISEPCLGKANELQRLVAVLRIVLLQPRPIRFHVGDVCLRLSIPAIHFMHHPIDGLPLREPVLYERSLVCDLLALFRGNSERKWHRIRNDIAEVGLRGQQAGTALYGGPLALDLAQLGRRWRVRVRREIAGDDMRRWRQWEG